ncbi:MAG TPA: hypothetical protein VKV28_06385 [Candidatus Binataceae bacterium]|nr:hypothetical protein [Candidatus Binataceae bacterium]
MAGGARAALALALLLGLLRPSAGWTDGGALYFSRAQDGLRVSLFGPALPLTPGISDLTVMVQDARDLQPILDARVVLVLSEGARSQSLRVRLTHREAADKLLYAGGITLARPGRWTANLQVAAGARKLEGSFSLIVVPGASFTQVWPYFALVVLVIFLFGWNQWLSHRQRVGPSHSIA